MAKKAAKKKSVAGASEAALMAIPSPEEVEEQQVLAEIVLSRFISWIYSNDSDPYYASLDPAGVDAFNKMHKQAHELLNSLQSAGLEKFASKARAQMPALKSAVADLKDELAGQKRAAALIGAFSKLLNVLVPILLA